MKCNGCGAILDVTQGGCHACGAAVELGRLTGILGVVCRDCDSYNEPGARVCAACGAALGRSAEPTSAAPAPPPGAAAPAKDPAKDPAAPPATAPAAPPAARPPPAPAQAGPVVRSFERPGAAPVTRFVPAAGAPPAGAGATPPGAPAPLRPSCPRCGARAGSGRFCAQCGQPLGAPATAVAVKAPPAASPVATRIGALAPGAVRLVAEGGAAPGASFALDHLRVEAGRGGAIAFPDDPTLAPHHATFSFRGGALHLRDEGAPGGVFLRLRALSVPLRPGDHFAVGSRLLRYAGRLAPAAEAGPDGTRRLGSPRPPASAVVVEERLEGGAEGRVFVRAGPSLTLGRAGAAVDLGDDPDVSQAHAELLVDAAGNARLKDLGSSAGTYLRLPPHGERELREGDLLRMGRQVLRVAVR